MRAQHVSVCAAISNQDNLLCLALPLRHTHFLLFLLHSAVSNHIHKCVCIVFTAIHKYVCIVFTAYQCSAHSMRDCAIFSGKKIPGLPAIPTIKCPRTLDSFLDFKSMQKKKSKEDSKAAGVHFETGDFQMSG